MNKKINLPNLRIGLEIHVQLGTETKLFSASENVSLQEPNTRISPLDIAITGALPLLNKKAVELAVIAGLHLNCKINKTSYFDRKHYNYPDLPLGYQITQFYLPIAQHGKVQIGDNEFININRIHMESDAGKLIHEDITLVDFNRCGCPLIEIVTEPDFTSIDQVDRFLNILAQTLRYANISDCDMSKGNLRVDVNISIDRNGKWGPRVEVKNLNSFKFIGQAILYEYERQKELNDNNIEIHTETRLYDSNRNMTQSTRDKEDAKDYMYMPDANIPPVVLSNEDFEKIKDKSPENFENKKAKLEKIINNKEIIYSILFNEKLMYLLEKILENKCYHQDIAAKVTAGELVNYLDHEIKPQHIATLCNLRGGNKISNNVLKQTIEQVIINNVDPFEYIKTNDLLQITDSNTIRKYIAQVQQENPEQWKQLQDGNNKLLAVITGKIIKLSSGKIDPMLVQNIIKDIIKA